MSPDSTMVAVLRNNGSASAGKNSEGGKQLEWSGRFATSFRRN
jgi:hypothetical protein